MRRHLLTSILALAAMFAPGLGMRAVHSCSFYALEVWPEYSYVAKDGGSTKITARVMIDGVPQPDHRIQFTVSGPQNPGSVNPDISETEAPDCYADTTYTSSTGTGTVVITATDLDTIGNPTEACSITVSGPSIDKGLPTSDINSGTNRSNFRWADWDSTIAYGDDFTLSSGNWKVDAIRVWIVPSVPIIGTAPGYYLGDHYGTITLYGGPSGSLSSLVTGTFSTGSDSITRTSGLSTAAITAVPVTYEAGQHYKTADGRDQQVWRMDFNNLDWSVTGGTAYIFGVHGTPLYDRGWFMHAQSYTGSGTGRDGKVWNFDTNPFAQPAQVDLNSQGSISGWFGKGSDINVQVFAHQVGQ